MNNVCSTPYTMLEETPRIPGIESTSSGNTESTPVGQQIPDLIQQRVQLQVIFEGSAVRPDETIAGSSDPEISVPDDLIDQALDEVAQVAPELERDVRHGVATAIARNAQTSINCGAKPDEAVAKSRMAVFVALGDFLRKLATARVV